VDNHDKWFFSLAGAFFFVTANRFGRELGMGLREPDDSRERMAAQVRWSILIWRLLGTVLTAYGAWLAVGGRTGQ
jgi:hypothetical protein